MDKKSLTVTAFALFSLFFGAGNLILPPLLGFLAGPRWWLVALGFGVTAVLIPILGILAHAKLQGTLFDLGKKVSPRFSLLYCYVVYAICLALPSPRTASVTHEMAVAPHWGSAPLWTSTIYFILVFYFVVDRKRILDHLGKVLTPAILSILLWIIARAVFGSGHGYVGAALDHPFNFGMLEGYQTFDGLGSVVVGAVIVVSVNLRFKGASIAAKKRWIGKAALWAGLGLLSVYTGLVYTGAVYGSSFDPQISRTELLMGIGTRTLGGAAHSLLALLVALACLTTAIGIVTGAADFVKSRFQDSHRAFVATALIGCVLGVLVGQLEVDLIITVAVPALMFIYPMTIVLILLNILPQGLASPSVFRSVIWVTALFSLPDFLESVGLGDPLRPFTQWIPLGRFQMGWILPALLVFGVANWRKGGGTDAAIRA